MACNNHSCNTDKKRDHRDTCCGKTETKTTIETTQYGANCCPHDGAAGLTYIGMRAVPIYADPVEWTSATPYEQLVIVEHNGDTYMSKVPVPAGIDISDTNYWYKAAKYNVQFEQLQNTVATFDHRITTNADNIATEVTDRESADSALRSAIDTETQNREAADTAEAEAREAADTAEAEAREAADTALQNAIDAESQVRSEADLAEKNAREAADDLLKTIDATCLGTLLLGEISFDDNNGMPDHPGAICQNGSVQYIISSPINEGAAGIGTAKGHFRTISIENNGDYHTNAVEADYGHANSICYSPIVGSLIYAPLWRVNPTTGEKTNCNFAETLTNAGAIGRRIPTNMANGVVGAVSHDWEQNKTYAFLDDEGFEYLHIAEYNLASDMFETTGAKIEYPFDSPLLRQDVAVKNGKFYACDTMGVIRIGDIETGEIEAIRSVERVQVAANGEVFQEWDGLEFNETGDLLQVVHSELNTSDTIDGNMILCREACAGVIQIIIGDGDSSFEQYQDVRLAPPLYTCNIDPNSTALKSRGSVAAPYKGFFQAQLSINNPRQVVLLNDYKSDMVFLFKELNLFIESNTTLETRIMRMGCDVSISGRNNGTSVLKTEYGFRFSQACQRVMLLKFLNIQAPANYNISQRGHIGMEFAISNDMAYPNGMTYGSTQLDPTKTYYFLVGFGQIV